MKLHAPALAVAIGLVTLACRNDEPAKAPSTAGSAGTSEETDASTPPAAIHATPKDKVVASPTPAAAPSTRSTTGQASPPPEATIVHEHDVAMVKQTDRGNAVTAMDQGNSGAEVQITVAIRRALMGDHALGFSAKNVKIITIGTKVTLRGRVANEHERTAIENYARATAGVSEIDNQIEVEK